MDREGSQFGDGGTDTRSEDNVVRFPRDWFGPTEDLIPFGARASSPGTGSQRRSGDEQSAPAGSIQPATVEIAVPAAPNADAFWGGGEELGAVQDAFDQPAFADADGSPGSSVQRRRSPRRLAAAALLTAVLTVAVLAQSGAPVAHVHAKVRMQHSSLRASASTAARPVGAAPVQRPQANERRARTQRRGGLNARLTELKTKHTAPASRPANPDAQQSVSSPQQPFPAQSTETTSRPAASSDSTSSPASSQPAGPTGPGALTGAGSTPSG